MDEVSARLLLLDEMQLALLLIGCVILGAVLGFVFDERYLGSTTTLRRVTYFFFVNLTVLLLTIAQIGWSLVPVAADAPLLSLAAAALLGLFFGAVLYVLSAARSRDMRGDTGRAWLAFIPGGVFYLFFARGQSTQEPSRSVIAQYVMDPMVVVISIFLHLTGQAISDVLERVDISPDVTTAGMRQVDSSIGTVEEILEREARASKAKLPRRIDDLTIMRDVQSEGMALIIKYDFTEQIHVRDDFERTVDAEMCRPKALRAMLARGAAVESIYTTPDGTVVAHYWTTFADCLAAKS